MGKLMKKIGIDLDKTIFTLKSLAYDILNKIQFLKNKDKIKYNEIKIAEVKDVNSVIKKYIRCLILNITSLSQMLLKL